VIPKIIHYCWFGGEPLPEEYSAYIQEWKNLHSNWEVIQWSESNSPTDEPYLANAIELKNWSNCSNFIRLWVLLKNGGVYLDTDFKLLKSLSPLLTNSCFLGFEQHENNDNKLLVNNAIAGSIANHAFIEACFNRLVSKYDGSEKSDLSGPVLTTNVLTELWGLKKYGMQELKNVTLYPTDYFYPIHVHDAYLLNRFADFITSNTFGIHMWGRSWVDRKQLLEIIDYLNYRVSNQENYIKSLEEKGKHLEDQKEEIFYWKSHFEKEALRLRHEYLCLKEDYILTKENNAPKEEKNSILLAISNLSSNFESQRLTITQLKEIQTSLLQTIENSHISLSQENRSISEKAFKIEKSASEMQAIVDQILPSLHKQHSQIETLLLEIQKKADVFPDLLNKTEELKEKYETQSILLAKLCVEHNQLNNLNSSNTSILQDIYGAITIENNALKEQNSTLTKQLAMITDSEKSLQAEILVRNQLQNQFLLKLFRVKI
jgi:mannosyltransferase OCH1-like enzyme